MNLLLPAAAGLGLLLMFSGSARAETPKKPGTLPLGGTPLGGTPPKKTATDFQGRIADALAAGNSDALMLIANDMQAAGLTAEAEALRTVAMSLKQLAASSGGKSPGQPVVAPSTAIPNPPLVVVPPLVSPSTVPLPAGVPVTNAQTQRLQVAQAMAVDLRNTSRYKENQVLVKRFQEQEGLVIDGKYGPKSALALASLGVIPPRPRYWARKTVQADKKQYAAEMMARAATDPSRVADWTAASKVANDPVA